MPQLKVAETERVILPSSMPDDEAWVEMKTRATHGDVTAARRAVVNISPAEMTMMAQNPGMTPARGIDMAVYPNALLAELITAWNFTDAGGEPVKVTAKAIELLDARDADFLWQRAERMTAGRPLAENGTSEKHS